MVAFVIFFVAFRPMRKVKRIKNHSAMYKKKKTCQKHKYNDIFGGKK